MPWIEITSYRVTVLHKQESDVAFHVQLQPEAGHAGPGQSGLHVYFSPDPLDAGQVTGDVILARMPETRFADFYRVLQTERPLYFWWKGVVGDADGALESCALSTVQEPAGEGPIDHSP